MRQRSNRLFSVLGLTAVMSLVLAAVAVAATIVGTPGDDTLNGTPRHDRIFARAGNDTVFAHAGRDRVFGGVILPDLGRERDQRRALVGEKSVADRFTRSRNQRRGRRDGRGRCRSG